MSQDRTFVERNRAATNRLRTLVEGLSEAELQQPVGEHWTVQIRSNTFSTAKSVASCRMSG